MKIGIPNIFTTCWYLGMLVCTGSLTYLSFTNDTLFGDTPWLVQLMMLLFDLSFLAVLLHLFYSFRLLVLKDGYIVFISPFLLKVQKLDLSKIRGIELKNWTTQNTTVHRSVKLVSSSAEIGFTDREFENFDALIEELEIVPTHRHETAFKQAKSNGSSMNINTYILSGFLVFIICNAIWNSGPHPFILTIIGFNSLLLFATIRRKKRYGRLIKKGSTN